MRDLGLALMLKYPDASNEPGGDYLVEDHGDGPELVEWNLPGDPPDVDQILRDHADDLREIQARSDPDFPSLEERVAALEREADMEAIRNKRHGQ